MRGWCKKEFFLLLIFCIASGSGESDTAADNDNEGDDRNNHNILRHKTISLSNMTADQVSGIPAVDQQHQSSFNSGNLPSCTHENHQSNG